MWLISPLPTVQQVPEVHNSESLERWIGGFKKKRFPRKVAFKLCGLSVCLFVGSRSLFLFVPEV